VCDARELVEARERLVVAIRIELLEARQAARCVEQPEQEEPALVRAAARALDAEVRPAQEHAVGPERDDVVGADRRLRRHREQRVEPAQERLDAAPVPSPRERWSWNAMSGAAASRYRSEFGGCMKSAVVRATPAARSRSSSVVSAWNA
jgi:hypothetical protein